VDNPYRANATGGDSSDIGAFEEQYSALVLQVENVAGQLLHIPTVLQPNDPTLRADNFNRPARGRMRQPDFLKLYLRGHSVTFQAQPFAQGG